MRAANSEVTRLLEQVNYYEDLLDITGERWSPSHKDYKATKDYMAVRQYHLALDTVEKLVVQRLFELQKTHLVNTGKFAASICILKLTTGFLGYRVRTSIASHLTNRADAIRTGVTKLNKAAAALPTPRPSLSVLDILSYSFLAEFDILRDSRDDIRQKAWANPSVRVIIEKYHRYLRAKEEILRLNIELRRLRTWIRDDEMVVSAALQGLRVSDPPLAYEISRRLRMRQLVHMKIESRLTRIEAMNAFSGIVGCGVGEFSQITVISVSRPTSPPLSVNDGGSEVSDDDLRHEDMDRINTMSEQMGRRP